MPRVVNRRDRPHDRDPVYVGRPTRWGNPFVIDDSYNAGPPATREEVIELYRTWLHKRPELIERARRELAGRDLECWCAPKACHADVLLSVANQGDLFL